MRLGCAARSSARSGNEGAAESAMIAVNEAIVRNSEAFFGYRAADRFSAGGAGSAAVPDECAAGDAAAGCASEADGRWRES